MAITGPAGSVLITSCAIVHAAGENRSGRDRPMVLAGYASADTVSYGGIPYKSRYRWRIVEGERRARSTAMRCVSSCRRTGTRTRGIRIDDLYQRQDG